MTATLQLPSSMSLGLPSVESDACSRRRVSCVVVDESPLCRKLLQLALADCDGAILTKCCSEIDDSCAGELPEVVIACEGSCCLSAISNWLSKANHNVQLLLLTDECSKTPLPKMSENVRLVRLRKPRFVSQIEAELADFSHCLTAALKLGDDR